MKKFPKEVELDFEIIREPWNKYSLNDGTHIKSRYILIKLKKKEPTSETEKPSIGVEGRNVVVTYNVPQNLKGPPSKHIYPPEELRKSIVQDDIRYTTIYEEWNEYIAEDGTRIRVKQTMTRVGRTDKADKNGDPIYFVDHSIMVDVKTMKR